MDGQLTVLSQLGEKILCQNPTRGLKNIVDKADKNYLFYFHSQRFMRKREVHISMLNIYIGILNLVSHSLR